MQDATEKREGNASYVGTIGLMVGEVIGAILVVRFVAHSSTNRSKT
jgi:hypothetical protein